MSDLQTRASARVDAATLLFAAPILRWTAALLWLTNVGWKVAPDFGRSEGGCANLCGYVEQGIAHPVLPGSPWVLEHVISPHLSTFGWVIVIVEAAVAVLMIAGRALRTASVLGAVQSIAIFATVANADGEWAWSYLLMIALHIAVLATASSASRPHVQPLAAATMIFGAAVALAHRTAGLTGDENQTWDLFDGRNDVPGDVGRNLFAGSIALGLMIGAVAVVVWAVARRTSPSLTRMVGIAVAAVGSAALVAVAVPRVEGAFGLRTAAACMVIGLGVRAATSSTSEARTQQLDPRSMGAASARRPRG